MYRTTEFFCFVIGKFLINNVSPGPDGDSSKVKVKVRINGNGVFAVSSASLYEKQQQTEDEVSGDQGDSQNAADQQQQAAAENGPAKESEAMQTEVKCSAMNYFFILRV